MKTIGALYFQAGNEDAEDMNDVDVSLSWRGNAEETHSDWSIVINGQDTYHVHKNILAVGAHCCMYFKTLFATNFGVTERADQTSRITLDNKDEAEAFPILLDFVYSTNDTLEQVTTENAVALRSLARYFRCPSLVTHSNSFIQSDLNTATAVTYLQKAHQSHDEKLVESTRRLIAENYSVCSAVDQLPFDLFRSVLSSPELKPDDHLVASRHVSNYFEQNPNLINAKHLDELTSSLTKIHPHAADFFLKLVAKLDPKQEHQEHWSALDKLIQLCSDSLATDWKNVDTDTCMRDFSNPSVAGDYHGSGRLVISRLTAALKAAQTNSAEMARQVQERDATIATQRQRITTLRREAEARRGQDQAPQQDDTSHSFSWDSDDDLALPVIRPQRPARRFVHRYQFNPIPARRGRAIHPPLGAAEANQQQEVVNLDLSSDSDSSDPQVRRRRHLRHNAIQGRSSRRSFIGDLNPVPVVPAAAQQVNQQAQGVPQNGDDSSDSDSDDSSIFDAESSEDLQPPRRRARR